MKNLLLPQIQDRTSTALASRAIRTLLLFATVVAVRGDTFVTATGTNTTLGTAQAMNMTPDLIIHQVPPNFTQGTAQPVSPPYMASEALGSVTASHTQEFFSMQANVGDSLHLEVSAANPATQFPQLLLYDPQGNLVAIADGNAADNSSSIIDFTVPSGESGTWTAEVAQSANHPPAGNLFNYDLRLSGSVITYSTDVLGALTDPNKPGFYSLDANVGDLLNLEVSAANPVTQFPQLLLYDPQGNLVAIADGNAADSSSSIIDFTVPSAESGNWTAEVAQSANHPPAGNLFNYDLLIQGDTGPGPVNPLPSPPSVPEPSTVTLLGLSMAAAGLISRRKRRDVRPGCRHNLSAP